MKKAGPPRQGGRGGKKTTTATAAKKGAGSHMQKGLFMQSAGLLAAEIAKFYATVQKIFPAPPLRHIILTIQGPNLLHTLPAIIAALLKTKMQYTGNQCAL